MHRKVFYIVSILLLALVFISCGGEAVPIVELTEAKMAISDAEEYRAQEYAPEKYNEAIAQIEESHDYVAAGDLDRATRRAINARNAAREAMQLAAPRMAEASIQNARNAIQRAVVVNAEVFAPEELQRAQTELNDAELQLQQNNYDSAISAGQSAESNAQQAISVSMGKKDLIRDAIMEVRQTLVSAQEYGAEEIQPDLFEQAKDELSVAVDTYREDKLKESYTAVRSSKTKADQLYAVVIERASLANINAAQDQLRRAQSSPGAAAARDELNASVEMLETARSQHNDGQFRESLDASNESLRLSAIVLGTEGVAQQPDVSEGLVETDEYWVYEVERGNYLRNIAKRFYDDEMKWRYIYDANRDLINNPDLIYPSWDLKVPKWDQPGGPVSDGNAVYDMPSSGEMTDTTSGELVTESSDGLTSDDQMPDDNVENASFEQAPETSSGNTVEVMPEN
jgi:nucleoid-associated protein YgaU